MSWLTLPAVPMAGFTILFGMARVERWLTRTCDAAAATPTQQQRAAASR